MPRRKKGCSEGLRSSSINSKEKPQQRCAANARERARMRVLSKAFCRLKTTLPWVPSDTKLSKLDTLRLASSYISHLKGILRDDHLITDDTSMHPAMTLTWPFGFNRGDGTGNIDPRGSSGSERESVTSCAWEEVRVHQEEHLDFEEDEDENEDLANKQSSNIQYYQPSFHHHHNILSI